MSFDGRVHDVSMRASYRDCDMFVAPSRYESLRLVFVEVMREARPLIGYAAGGMREVGSDGAALGGDINRLAALPELRERIGRARRALPEDKFISRRRAQDGDGDKRPASSLVPYRPE